MSYKTIHLYPRFLCGQHRCGQRTSLALAVLLAFLIVPVGWTEPGGSDFSARGRRRDTGRGGMEDPKAIEALDALVERLKKGEQPQDDDIQRIVSGLDWRTRSSDPAALLGKLRLLQQVRGDMAFPTPDKPLTTEDGLARLITALEVRWMEDIPSEQTRAHPAAVAFPGIVPVDAERITRKIVIDTNAPGWHNFGIYGNPRSPYWHSTGLYAPPGEVVLVRAPKGMVNKGLYVRIGAHSDKLWRRRSWSRAPDICRRFPIEKSRTKAANAFGGLIYIETPFGLEAGAIPLTISGAVKAPHYVLGKTDAKQWRETIRFYPAPWAELESRKVILTLPSKVIRTLEDPEELMKFWDGIMDGYAELLGRDTERRRVERFVSDVQISAGYMHSGYPLMTMLDITTTMVDKDRISSNGHHGVWGLFHEIGHNHQNSQWTFRGTTEVTVNLFSLYLMEKVCGLISEGHPSITKQARAKNTKKYLAEGADFEKWKRSPFLALCMYMQMKEAFGWDAFKKVFAEYRDLSEDQRPKSDDEKRDQWMVRFSRTVGRNLGPFFEAWGIPTSEKARASIADLPLWMPEGFPPEDNVRLSSVYRTTTNNCLSF